MPEKNSKLRIIAGKLRGRKICFNHKNPKLRPTLDRVRETLFNWLATKVVNSNCLDLYAGSGLLGLEALSRGAKFTVAVEQDQDTYHTIINNKINLGLSDQQLVVINQDVLWFLQQSNHLLEHSNQFDIIFLDPPYNNSHNSNSSMHKDPHKKDLLSQSLSLILKYNYLSLGGKIYFECRDHNYTINQQLFNTKLKIIKSSKAGNVFFYLAERIK